MSLKPNYSTYSTDDVDLTNLKEYLDDEQKIAFNKIKTEFENIEFSDIKFEFAKTEIVNGTEKRIDNVIDFLRKYSMFRIKISGHADKIGSTKSNYKLSLNRANAVKTLIVKQGIPEGRLTIEAYGELKPKNENDSESGRQKNRRVEFKIVE